jgi:hypothetical protein
VSQVVHVCWANVVPGGDEIMFGHFPRHFMPGYLHFVPPGQFSAQGINVSDIKS